MTDTLEIYVQKGARGYHAGARGFSRVWAAHPDDEETAAWRCALRRWFPKRANGVLLYREVLAIRVATAGDQVYSAVLDIPDSQVNAFSFARDFTPELPVVPRAKRSTRKGRKK